MNLTITYTNGEKKKFSNIMEIYEPNNSQELMLVDTTGIKNIVYKIIIKKIEVKP